MKYKKTINNQLFTSNLIYTRPMYAFEYWIKYVKPLNKKIKYIEDIILNDIVYGVNYCILINERNQDLENRMKISYNQRDMELLYKKHFKI